MAHRHLMLLYLSISKGQRSSMYYWRTVCSIIQKQRIDSYNRIQVINRGYKHSCLLRPCISNEGYSNKFICAGSNFEQIGKTNLSMNFFTTAGVRSSGQRTNQDKEKMKNYIVFGGIMGFSLLVFVVYMIISNTHYDHVYIKEKKSVKD